MQSQMPDAGVGWRARLGLGLACSGARTVLRNYSHEGPLYVQRALYPERDGCAHLYLLHPPGGLVQGDRIDIDMQVQRDARVLVTTPSAAKLYRTPAGGTHQYARVRVAADASAEWLPQEAIVFDGAHGRMQLAFELDADARLIAWDAFALGRPAAGEPFAQGLYDNHLSVRVGERLLWHERTQVPGSATSRMQCAAWGLNGHPVLGTLVAYAPAGVDADLETSVREVLAVLNTPSGVTRVDGLLIVRVLAMDTGRLQQALRGAWTAVRPVIMGKPVLEPRIWAT
jgi:urease accessory protein